MNITNKTVLITGGGSGIGFETAKFLPNTTAISCDITNEQDVKNLVAQVSEEYPELSVLINNAGRAFAYTHDENAGAFEKSTEEFATNYFSLIRLTEGFLPLLKAQAEAAIINVTSIVAFTPSANLPSYSDSKAAVRSYTLSLRYSLAKNTSVKVFELMPPMVNTEFSKDVGGEHGISPVDVAQGLIEGITNDEFEIKIGQTADFRKFYLSATDEAFAMLNQPLQ